MLKLESTYQVSAHGQVFGTYEAADEQGARDACAQDAGYKSEADMVEQTERLSELVAELIEVTHEAGEEAA